MYFSRSIKRFVLYAYFQNKKKAPAEPMLSVGSVGFGPTKDEPTDLQSAPFDHSGNSPSSKEESRHRDSNLGPRDYKSRALPTEL